MADYKGLSEYVRMKIEGRSFKNEKYRWYIKELLRLEGYAIRGRWWRGSAYEQGIGYLHDKEFTAILKELNPKKYPEWLNWFKEEKRVEQERNRKEALGKKKLEAAEKRWWVKMGGTI
ncbi:hypothetical protein L0Y65_06965 [Candidatus Micrarchaeota archaeon]|nr:hypothetical protein [Candidatus Micrarchaeota archaeon]